MDDHTLPEENELWYIISAYVRKYGFVRHQIESFNWFTTTLLPHIIQESPEIREFQCDKTEEHVITLTNVSIMRPTIPNNHDLDLEPHIARLRNLTYASTILVDVVHDIFVHGERTERRLFRETCLCRLPVMIGSQCCHTQHRESKFECRLDQGGYFIVSGCEKVVVAQEKLHHNTPYVFSVKQPSRFALQCEIRSCHERKLRSTSSLYIHITNSKNGTTPEMVVTVPFVGMYIPIMALFRLLGVTTRPEAIAVIVGDNEANEARLLMSIIDNDPTADMEIKDLYEHIGKEGTREPTQERRQKYIDHILNCEVLPHQGLTGAKDVMRVKALYVGLMVRRLIRVYTGVHKCDDRDHYAAKRIDCAGTQFGLLFRQVFRNMYKAASLNIHNASLSNRLRFLNVGSLFAGKKLTHAFRYALATGNWGIMSAKGNSTQNGVTQQLARMTIPATISLLRKVATPVPKETKNPKPRQLHHTSWGLICPMDTPEGAACGLTKSLAIMTHIRVGTYSDAINDQLDLLALDIPGLYTPLEAPTSVRRDGIPVLVNGTLYQFAMHSDTALALSTRLRQLRAHEVIPYDTTIAHVDNFLYIDTDTGCLMRPLLVVSKLRDIHRLIQGVNPDHLIDHLYKNGVFEYIDKQEEQSLRVALSPLEEPKDGWAEYTHCEFHASLITGICGGCIPFADLNQSPRNTYQSAMMKQALGVYSLNYQIRMDTVSHTMVCPQRPLVTTRLDTLVGASEAPAGVNVIVAIMCYTGQNQEDSVIINQSALDRGLFRSIKFQTYRDEEKHNGGTDAERFEDSNRITGIIGKRSANYSHLDDSGLVPVGTSVKPNDVIICKTITTTELGEGARRVVKRDNSTILRQEGVVDAILKVTKEDGTKMVKLRVRKTRTPIVGDKVSSRMGQKGVIGTTLKQEDMPYTDDGIVPDIIVNPHAIPSRMTIGQLCETLLGILCTITGERGDGTIFRGTSLEFLCAQLKKEGYDETGSTRLHSGFTGEAFECKVFMGPTYYQRLRHMAEDKDHARSRGPVQMLSRQPTEGRSRDGGLRFGEMERDTLISHGAAEFLKDRLLDNSDPSHLTICGKCGLIAQPSARNTLVRNRLPYCRICDSTQQVRTMQCPVAFRLLVHELLAMNILIRFSFSSHTPLLKQA